VNFPWLRPHLISYYKTIERKNREANESAYKEKQLALVRASLTMVPVKNDTGPDLLSESDCISSNSIMGDDDESTDDENTVDQMDGVNQLDILPADCQHFLITLGIFTTSSFLIDDAGDLMDK
jgi:hypothetical protein